jgi:CO/xanthine dehydrogenase FAD-binding subunit
MIIEYQRPKSLQEALTLLTRQEPPSVPMGGGSILSKSWQEDVAVIDLQHLALNTITDAGEKFEIGATATLAQLDHFFADTQLSEVIRYQAGKNLRNVGTLAGLVASANGRSPLLTLLLGLDVSLIWQPGDMEISLGNWLPQRNEWRQARLITQVNLPKVSYRFAAVARTPKDVPIVAVAAAKWPNQRLRVAVGGFGAVPVLALDGKMGDDAAKAVDQAFAYAEDEWAHAAYRRQAAAKLAARLVAELAGEEH